jgi:hypothetical protein
MRRILKQQVLEITRLLDQIHDGIRIKLQASQKEEILRLLEQCQDAAINIGEAIEQEEGEDFVTVTYLEEYCETVYRIYEQVLCGQPADPSKIYKKLRKDLIQIENSIKKDIKVHIELLFLPYKASMWDSLESIWKAADSDPDCRACVVPIPYYEKTPNGALGQMHDEQDMYPDEVPVIDWHTYNIETRHPDAVFIHSPYDSGNRVTTIHPDFYSNRLKEYTDLLVYVPYYVTLGILPEGLCITSGTLNADRVIVQSESVRQNYIHAYKEFEKSENCEGRYGTASKKFLALGSPKFDKVVCSEKTQFELPDKWKRLIDTGHTQKTVVFYNTSINGLLKGNERYLEKLRSVLKTFQAHKNIVLWWRPHPLNKTAVCSMRPELLQEYEQIIMEYRQENWGIYDDTPDLHRAIAWSDAYYGDQSSVEVLFHAAGKPVMQQEIDDLPLVFENFIQVDNDYWFTAFNLNGLFRMNAKTWKADFMGCFPGENDWLRLYFNIIQYKNLLIFAPFAAQQIALYRMDTSEFINIPLHNPQDAEKENTTGNIPYVVYRKFSVCTQYGGYAFFFPCTYPAIIKLNLETYETEYMYEPLKQLNKLAKRPELYYFRKGVQIDNVVKLWCVAANASVEFDMETCQLNICGAANDGTAYIEAVYDDECCWLFPKASGKAMRKLTDDPSQNAFIDLSRGGTTKYIPYLHAVNTEDFIYAFPTTAEHVLKINKRENLAEVFPLLDSENTGAPALPSSDWRFFIAGNCGDKIFAFNAISRKLILYDPVSGSIKREHVWSNHKVLTDNTSLLKVWELYYERIVQEEELAVKEERRKTLNAYLKLLVQNPSELLDLLHKAKNRLAENGGIQTTGTCGQTIYNCAKKYLLEEQRRTL